jgi:NH3-dependent NAD+ synthetase
MVFDALKVKNEIVEWIRDWFEANGKGCNAVLGISGGKDSSVVAALCVEALGKDRVVGVLMPNGEQFDIDVSKALVAHLGIRSNPREKVCRVIESMFLQECRGYEQTCEHCIWGFCNINGRLYKSQYCFDLLLCGWFFLSLQMRNLP